MFVVVSYDITDDKRRRRVQKWLENFGTRVQYSVFECDLKEPPYKRMRGRIKTLIAPQEDSVRFYFLDEDAIQKIQVEGLGRVERAREYYVVG